MPPAARDGAGVLTERANRAAVGAKQQFGKSGLEGTTG
jgi:hypothetical protein